MLDISGGSLGDRSINDISYSHFPTDNITAAQTGLNYTGENYTVYGKNRISDVSLCTLGTGKFRISTTVNFDNTSLMHAMASCFENIRHGLLLFGGSPTLYIIMYANTGQANPKDVRFYSSSIATQTDYNIVITRTDTSYNVVMNRADNGNSVPLTYLLNSAGTTGMLPTDDCGNYPIRLGGMGADFAAPLGANFNDQKYSGQIKKFKLEKWQE